MLEIVTRTFQLQEGESKWDMAQFIKRLPGCIPESIYFDDKEITAKFSRRII